MYALHLAANIYACRRKASADNYRRAEHAKLQAQAERKDVMEQLKRVKRHNALKKSRFESKEESVHEFKKVVHNKNSEVKQLQKNLATMESRWQASAAEGRRAVKQKAKAQAELKDVHEQLTRVMRKMARYESEMLSQQPLYIISEMLSQNILKEVGDIVSILQRQN